MAMESIADFLALPLERYRHLRASQPVVYDLAYDTWNVYRYADAVRVLNDPSTFSSEPRSPETALPSIVGMDGARHRKLRSLVTQAFTPRMVEQLAPRIVAVTTELLDAAVRQDHFDAIQDFAYPLPIRIIVEMLGVPLEEQATFRRWSETLVAGPRTDALRGQSFADERVRIRQELVEYLGRQLGMRRAKPGDDLISRLLSAEVDGDRLDETEVVDFVRLLLIAGYETTACQIGNALLTLHELPAVTAELRADPDLMPGAVEEIVRCFPSVAATVRVARRDVEIAGRRITQGQSLIVWTASTNYDETVFPHSERFDIHRAPNRHLGFGLGPHFCLGAPLARLELRTALRLVLERLPKLERDAAQPIEPVDSPFLFGVKNLHLLL